MNRITLQWIGVWIMCAVLVNGQVVPLNECQAMAGENYPAIARFSIMEQTKEYTLANANKGYLPQLTVDARATYQTDVITIPLNMPGVEIAVPDKDQY